MSQLRERFIRDLSIRNYSQSTIRSYVAAIQGLSVFHGKCPTEIGGHEIKDYLAHLHKRGLGWSTINHVISACNRLYTDTLGQVEKVQSVKRPKAKTKLPVVFSEEEVEIFLNCIRNIKHRAIFMTIYSGGLRAGEVCRLKINEIDSGRARIIIRDGKGHKDREVILSERLLTYLRKYVQLYRPKEFLFNGQYPNTHITQRTIQQVFQTNLKKSGIGKKASVHTLRHSFATHLMNKGIDIRIVQQLLGHKSIKTTLVYCHLAKDRFGKTKSPLDDLSI